MFDEGIAYISAILDKDSYTVGDIVHVECFVNNTRCQKAIKCVKISLVRSLKGIDGHDVKNIEETITQ